jgi:hypothetical protein
MKSYTGGCHCGAVRFEAQADIDQVIECNCSHCQGKGVLLSFIPAEQFTFLSGEKELTEYRFNKKSIAHLFCRICGIEPIGRATNKEGKPTVALNVRAIDDLDISTLTRIPYDGKSLQ